jgi:hypothetical protein
MEDDIKRILQDKQFHLQLKLGQKEIIQNASATPLSECKMVVNE